MNLERLGFSQWFQKKLDLAKLNDFQKARVTSVHKESYAVTDGEKRVNSLESFISRCRKTSQK